MVAFYDARGNTYFVATPEELRPAVALPGTAAEAARRRDLWAGEAVDRVCATAPGRGPAAGKSFRSDGLLVGPFAERRGFGLLIVNTDGTLAERSGNGLTIFARYLVDSGEAAAATPLTLRVYHDNPDSGPTEATIEPGDFAGEAGVWVDMGIPTFGPEAVEAAPGSVGVSLIRGVEVSRVFELEAIIGGWTRSQFVNVGNPHCVTFVGDRASLPEMGQLASEPWLSRLRAIADSAEGRGAGHPCRKGINLQWAAVTGPDAIEARVFERGEGPTKSSGSSATAVASAARRLRLVDATTVRVTMPGGVIPIKFEALGPQSERAILFGQATKKSLPT